MRVTILPQNRQLELDGRRRVGDLVRELGFLPGTVLVIRNDELVMDQEFVESDEVIEVRNVISGG